MRTRLLTIGVAALLALVMFPSRGAACSCVSGIPICEMFWSTDLVFSGTVLDIVPAAVKSPMQRPLGYGRVVRFRVAQTWKGEAAGTIEINTGMGGGDCGYNFVKGQDYLVYARGSSGNYSTGICNRTRRLTDAAEDLAYFKTALEPSAGGRIFGTATYQRTTGDAGVRPVVGYTVTLRQGEKQWTSTTGNDGAFEFRGIPAGSYSVTLNVPGTEQVFGPRTTELKDPRGCATASFIVVPGSVIDANMLDADGRVMPATSLDAAAVARR